MANRLAAFNSTNAAADRRASIGDPAASVVVLTHDRPDSLARCLESLIHQRLDQPFEIIVADDGSRRETTQVVREAQQRDGRIRHVRHDHRGIPATRNLGVQAARGHRVAIVADDYVLAPDYLSKALDYLDAHPEAAVVRSDLRSHDRSFGARLSDCFYSASFIRRLAREGISVEQAERGVATATLDASGGAVFRSEVLEKVGWWDESFLRGEDSDYTRRLRSHGFEVHLLAAGTVRHHYRRIPVDTLYKCFVTGIYRARLGPDHGPRSAGKIRDLAKALDRARQAGESWQGVVVYLPWMLLFELAARGGVLIGRAQLRFGRRRVDTSLSRIPEGSVR